jgi:hypothetical protein
MSVQAEVAKGVPPALRIRILSFWAEYRPACLVLVAGLTIMNPIRFFVWLASGLVFYFSYGRTRCALREWSEEYSGDLPS